MSEENVFRVPTLPVRPKNRSPKTFKSPLQEKQNVDDAVRMSFSPGTSATALKRDEKLRRLRLKAERRSMVTPIKQTPKPKLDLSLSEQALTAQPVHDLLQPMSTPSSALNQLDVSSIAKDSSFLVVNTPSRGPAFSTPYSVRRRMQPRSPSTFKMDSPNSTAIAIESPSRIHESHEDRLQRQMDAFAVWSNSILKISSSLCEGEVDLGTSTKEATKKLQEFLTQKKNASSPGKKSGIAEILSRPGFSEIRLKAKSVFDESDIPFQIRKLIDQKAVTIRPDCHIFNDIGLKTSILRIFLSFHPVWLHLGLQIVLGRDIPLPQGSSFGHIIARTIDNYVFSDPGIIKNRKFVIGSVKKLLTPEGEAALNRHFLRIMCQFLFCEEMLKTSDIVESDPRLFTRKSPFKSIEAVCSELSRLVLAASSLPLMKMFMKIGFKPIYKQGFFDDFDYTVREFTDFCDGVIIGKLIEIICSRGKGEVMKKLRNPAGDRIRKIGNVTVALEEAANAGYDVGALKPESIVSASKESILELLWRLVGVYVMACQSDTNSVSQSPRSRGIDGVILERCRRMEEEVGVRVNTVDSLNDGRFLSAVYQLRNPRAQIESYPGDLLDKVALAAEADFEIPIALKDVIPLFTHLLLNKLDEIEVKKPTTATPSEPHQEFTQEDQSNKCDQLSSVTDFDGRVSDASTIRGYGCDATFIVNAPRGRAPDVEELSSNSSGSEYNGQTELQSTSSLLYSERCAVRLDGGRAAVGFESVDVFQESAPCGSSSSVEVGQYVINLQAHIRGALARRKFLHSKIAKNLKIHSSRELLNSVLSSTDFDACLRDIIHTEHSMYTRSVIKLQSLVRGFLARKHFIVLKRNVLTTMRNNAANVVQRAVRSWIARKQLEKYRQEHQRRVELITMIQSCIRGYIARRKFLEMQEQQKIIANVVLIQSVVRRYLAGKVLVELKRMRDEKNRIAAEVSVVHLQPIAKGMLFRRWFADFRLKTDRMRKEKEVAVVKIQSCIRRWIAVKKLASLRQAHLKAEEKRNHAVIVLQAVVRRYLAKKTFEALKQKQEEQRRMEAAVLKIQCCVRRWIAVEKLKILRQASQEEKRRNEMAVVLQSYIRRWLAREKFKILKEDYVRFVGNVIRVQALVRRHLAMKKLAVLKEAKFKRDCLFTKWQALCRGAIARENFNARLLSLHTPVNNHRQQNPSSLSIDSPLIRRMKLPMVEMKRRRLAAITIQSWWRGVRTRKLMSVEIQARKSHMQAYMENVVNQEEVDADMKDLELPARQRLLINCEKLFDMSLYRCKVAAVIIDRITSLSPCLTRFFAEECNGLVVLLDRIETCNRAPGNTEIVESIASILRRLSESEDRFIRCEIEAHSKDFADNAVHLINAYFGVPIAVTAGAAMLMAVRIVSPGGLPWNSSTYFLGKTAAKISRLPAGDERHVALLKLKEAFSPL